MTVLMFAVSPFESPTFCSRSGNELSDSKKGEPNRRSDNALELNAFSDDHTGLP